jgi:hypothetical protein
MRKVGTILLSICFTVAVTVAVFGNAQILNKEVNGKKVHFATKDGKKVNACIYCHTTAKFEKKKLGFLKGQPKFNTLKTNKLCSGAGCHM